jgi:hypothetical protein
MENLPVLYSSYFAPIENYSVMMKYGGMTVDVGEHYVKRSYRNKCSILSANGVMALTVPLSRSSSDDADLTHAAMKDLKVSYDDNWRHVHWQSLVSAYNMSPFFEYYEDDIKPLFERKFDYLVDLNAEAMDIVNRLLMMDDVTINVSETYIPAQTVELDLRNQITPKTHLDDFCQKEYYQVFSEKYGFQPNLSILDLLFNLGPESRVVLRDSLKQ